VAADFAKVDSLVRAFDTLSGEMGRVRASLSPRERLAFAAGLRLGHIEKARAIGEPERAVAHEQQYKAIAERLGPARTRRERAAMRAGVFASHAEEGLVQGRLKAARPAFVRFAKLMVALGNGVL
jgi:hypothetical protein